MNMNKIIFGILSVFLLAPSLSFGYEMPEVPKVTPPSSQTSQRLCWDSIAKTEYPCAPGTPYATDRIEGQSQETPSIMAKMSSTIGRAFSQLVKIAEDSRNWIANFFGKK